MKEVKGSAASGAGSDRAIHRLRAFGWQNGHLHHFSLPEDVFAALTDNQFSTWAELAGVYFRFPTENYEDIYWDDDYGNRKRTDEERYCSN